MEWNEWKGIELNGMECVLCKWSVFIKENGMEMEMELLQWETRLNGVQVCF